MAAKKKNISRNELVRWVRSQPEFTEGLFITSVFLFGVQFALLDCDGSAERYFVGVRRNTGDIVEAKRVRLGVMRATPRRRSLVGQTELVIREDEDSDEVWRAKLSAACERLDVPSEFIVMLDSRGGEA
jgi:hypothetical protein